VIKFNIDYSESPVDGFQDFEKAKTDTYAETQLKNIIPKRFHGSRIGHYKTPIDDLVRTFCTSGQGQVFLLSGSVGTGKSTVGFASMYERALKGLNAGEYLSARLLCPILRSKQNFNSPESEFDFIMRMGTTPYFFYDEAGKADDKEIEWAFLSKVLAIRYDNMLDSFITTNMGLGDFAAFIKHSGKGEDIYTRIKSNLITACFTGECFRRENVIA
jgi:DNA replication protein DnaC